MSRNLKYHLHGKVIYITSSIEQGVLFLNNPVILLLLRSCLAAALAKYKAKLCHFIVEPTHFHIIVVIDNPEDISNFIGYFKCETAHRINRILGRPKRTVWCAGYDSPTLVTPLRALIAIAYIYSNPGKDNLSESIDSYLGFSSWKMFTTGEFTETVDIIDRDEFKYIPFGQQNEKGYAREAARLLATSTRKETLTIEPNAWLDAYGIKDSMSQLRWNSKLVERLRFLEQRAANVRKKTGRRVMSAFRQRNEKFDTTKLSKRKRGKRSIALSERKRDRKDFIATYWKRVQEAKDVVKRWRQGDTSVRYPPGLYAPSMPRLANIVP